MMRSLYSGVAGLKTHQTKMDVIGNNIANVNTVGFKSSQVLFQDVLYQTTQRATGATANSGGTNAKQIGLGTSLATIKVSQTSGSAQSTNNPYDLMINGSSFFIVNRGGINYFTKVGSFDTDDAGNLVTGAGDFVMGWQVDPDNPNQIRKDTVSVLRPEAEENQTAAPELTSKTYLSGNVDMTDPNLETADGVVRTVSIYDNLGYSYTVKLKVTSTTSTGGNVSYNVEVDSIKDSNNVDILKNGYKATWISDNDPAEATNTMISFDSDSGKFVSSGNNKLKIVPTNGGGDIFRDATVDPPVKIGRAHV